MTTRLREPMPVTYPRVPLEFHTMPRGSPIDLSTSDGGSVRLT